ncbi:MAG: hypothetical protein ABIB43_06760 [archaeon]
MLEQICEQEYFGLNPNQSFGFVESAFRKNRVLGVIALTLSFNPTIMFDYIDHFNKKAEEMTINKKWSDIEFFDIKTLNDKKAYSDNYLTQTAGHIRIIGTPSQNKIVGPKGGSFVTGGLIPREVSYELSFYIEDKNGLIGYLGLTPELNKAWPHILVAADHKKEVEIGLQLNRGYDLFRNSYVVNHISFPAEKVTFGDPIFKMVEKPQIQELSESNITEKNKNRIFRSIAESGYIF